jgi:hypothetical protein
LWDRSELFSGIGLSYFVGQVKVIWWDRSWPFCGSGQGASILWDRSGFLCDKLGWFCGTGHSYFAGQIWFICICQKYRMSIVLNALIRKR